MATYNYSTSIFTSGYNLDKLTTEINNSSIAPSLKEILVSGEDVYVDFNGTLSSPEETTLDNILDNHTGTLSKTIIEDNEIDNENINVRIKPVGTGTVVVGDGSPQVYEQNIQDNSLITKSYFTNNMPSATSVELPTLQVRRTSTYNNIPTSWTDLTFNTTDVENEPTIIEHNNTNIDDIDIKEDGMYLLHYNLISDHDIGGRIRINDSTVIPGSTKSVGVQMPYVSNVFMGNSVSVVANLTAGQKLTIQIQAYASSQNLQANSTFIVTKLQGAKGEKGDPGSGSTIEIENDDSSINSATSTLNFEGSGVVVADEGNGKVTATISGGVYGQNFQHNAVDTTSSTTSQNYQQKVSITTSSLESGTYRIGWFIETANNNSSGRTEIRVQINNSTTLCESSIEAEDSNDWVPFSGFYHASLSGSKTIDLDYRRGNNRGTTSVRNARLEIWRVS